MARISREEHRARMRVRRERQQALKPGIVKANLLVPSRIVDPVTKLPRPKMLLAMPVIRGGCVGPHKHERERARRLRQIAA